MDNNPTPTPGGLLVSRRDMLLRAAKLTAAAAMATAMSGSFAQDVHFPTKPVTLVVAFAPGGVMDYIARAIAPKLSAVWGQPVIVDNRPGANGIIAASTVTTAPPDGHTLLLGYTGLALNQFLMKSVPYDAQKSFAPITTLTWGSSIFFINPEVPAKTFKEFVDYVKSRPGVLSFASSGVGTAPHLTAVMLQQATNTQMVHVPYKGSAPAVNDLIAGQVQAMFDYAVPSAEFVRSGKLRALFVAGSKRNPSIPDVPTAAEVGLPGFDSVAWSGLFAPASAPEAVIRKISRDLTAILATPEEQARGTQLGIEFRGSSPEVLRDVLAKDIRQWGDVIKQADIKLLE